MNRFKLTSVLCGGMLSLTGTTLLAQSASPSSSITSQPSEQSQTSDPSQQSSRYGQSSAAGISGDQWQHSRRDVRLSELMNATVQSRDGKTLGQVRDFTINPQSGRIDFAVLSLSPTAGTESSTANSSATSGQSSTATLGSQPNGSSALGQSANSTLGNQSTTSSQLGGTATASTETGKLIPVPWQLFRHGLQSSENQTASALGAGQSGMHTLVLNIDESKLQSAPSFTSSDWSELRQPNFHQQVYSFYGVNRMSGVGTSGSNISGQGESSYDKDRSAKGGASDLLNQPAHQPTPPENK